MNKLANLAPILLTYIGLTTSSTAFAMALPFNQAPVAIIDEIASPLIVGPNQQLFVYVGNSYDPDPLDAISQYALDLNGDHFFDIFATPSQPSTYFDLLSGGAFHFLYTTLTGTYALNPGNHDIQLRVIDTNGALSFDTASITILPSEIPNSVPEPQTLALIGVSLGGILAMRRKNAHATKNMSHLF